MAVYKAIKERIINDVVKIKDQPNWRALILGQVPL
jgi:hypothetical protein